MMQRTGIPSFPEVRGTPLRSQADQIGSRWEQRSRGQEKPTGGFLEDPVGGRLQAPGKAAY